ncbi:IclR family transcriptional regulator [Granulosicoccus antarcticus]|uniref:HTH-type transcriptional repressor AllR n=1 Tax=Granulosicoccus antarcticus IMCC3135 TaxID=1192854 RepID=A0A2Z2NP63_9GAMM|nr:IclR family transcriptional regulator [Granulosicoccus antarcticus]ASJ73216.1 Pectin degradation repressor protein KdgR [Granulosicoccus antarcticus IMCC3135]
MPKRGEGTVSPLTRSILVLEEVARHRKACSFTSLMRELKFPKSTLHRVLTSLTDECLLEFNAEENGYRLGLRLSALSLKAVHGLKIRDAVRPEIETLGAFVKENVLVGQRDDTKLLYVDRVDSQQTIQMISQLGNRGPLHCTGLGKAILAFTESEITEALIPRMSLDRFTENTICETDRFSAELDKIRQQGFAMDDCEHQMEIHCIAAPVFGMNGHVIAAISISAPVFRVSRDTLISWIPKLLETSQRISLKLGDNKETTSLS